MIILVLTHHFIYLFAAALAETEALYQTFPSYEGPTPPRRIVVELTFRRAPPEGSEAPADEGEGEEEEEGGAGAKSRVVAADKDITVMSVQVGYRDTIDSLNRRIRVSLLCKGLDESVMINVIFLLCYQTE